MNALIFGFIFCMTMIGFVAIGEKIAIKLGILEDGKNA